MPGVQSTCGRVLTFGMQQMAKIVQKGRGDQGFATALALHKPRSLQAVFQHRHRLAEISLAAPGSQQGKYIIN